MINTTGVNQETLVITSAIELTEDQINRIADKFKEKTGVELTNIETRVDSKLLTGVRLQSESFYYEVSGRKTLEDIERNLMSNSSEGAE